jgi:multicomponent Na+:H+ antiporter subunit D
VNGVFGIDVNNLLPLFVAIPLGVAFLMPMAAKLRRERLLDVIAMFAALSLFALAVALMRCASGQTVYWVGNWKPPVLGICLVCDGLTRLMLLVVNVVAFLITIYAGEYMKRYTSPGLFYSLFFSMIAGMNGVVLTGDFFNLYVFLEVASLCSYALVAFGIESEQLEASFKYLVLGSISTLVVLTGVVLLYSLTGTLNMAQVAQVLAHAPGQGAAHLALGLFLAGFALKAAMVPFHAWLPDAHPAAPAPVSAMLSGLLIKAIGVYALCRITFNVFGPSLPVGNVLMALGAISMVVGVFLAVGQWDLKRLLAYHSISQMGYVVMAMGVGLELLARPDGSLAVASLAVFGGLFHMVNHAAFKSLLFLTSGAIEYATGTRDLKELGGLSKTMPVTAFCCRTASLSIAGVPPFNGFWSKLIIIIAVVQAGHYLLGTLAVIVSFMTLVSFVKVQRYALAGEPSEKAARAREVPAGMAIPMVALAAVCLVLGVAVFLYTPFADSVLAPARDVMVRGVQDYIGAFRLPELP